MRRKRSNVSHIPRSAPAPARHRHSRLAFGPCVFVRSPPPQRVCCARDTGARGCRASLVRQGRRHDDGGPRVRRSRGIVRRGRRGTRNARRRGRTLRGASALEHAESSEDPMQRRMRREKPAPARLCRQTTPAPTRLLPLFVPPRSCSLRSAAANASSRRASVYGVLSLARAWRGAAVGQFGPRTFVAEQIASFVEQVHELLVVRSVFMPTPFNSFCPLPFCWPLDARLRNCRGLSDAKQQS